MEEYSAIKDMEILPFATTWMELGGIIRRNKSERKPLYKYLCGKSKSQSHGNRPYLWLSGQGSGKMGNL